MHARNGKHVLVTHTMKPKEGCDYSATAARFAAKSFLNTSGTPIRVSDVKVYHVDPQGLKMKTAYPVQGFGQDRSSSSSWFNLSLGQKQSGLEDVQHSQISDFYLPPSFLRLYDGPASKVGGTWRILGRHVNQMYSPPVSSAKSRQQPSQLRQAKGPARYALWQGGEFFQNTLQHGGSSPETKCIPEVLQSMEACIKQMGPGKVDVAADDAGSQMTDPGRYILSQFGPLSKTCMALMEGYVAGDSANTRSGTLPVTDMEFERGYMAFVHTKLSRVIAVSVPRADAAKRFGKVVKKHIELVPPHDAIDGLLHVEEWEGAEHAVPIISSSTTALHLPGIFEKLGHANVILTAGSGCFGHKGGPTCGAHACQQAEEAWKAWKSGKYGDMSLSDAVIEFAQTHEELRGAFLTFQQDADRVYPGWREKLSSAGMSPLEMAHARVARQVLGQSSSAALHLDEDSLMK